ncbi:hypothetical protein C0991_010925 [Blastosporella zonata]|nr:hypothetical protein C0991_010925 [Blastosporella zonata]
MCSIGQPAQRPYSIANGGREKGYMLQSFDSFCADVSKTVKSSWNGDHLAAPADFDLNLLVKYAVAAFGNSPEHTSPPWCPGSPPYKFIQPTANPNLLASSTPLLSPTATSPQGKKSNRAKRRNCKNQKKKVLKSDPTDFRGYQVPLAALKRYQDWYTSNPLALNFYFSKSKVA